MLFKLQNSAKYCLFHAVCRMHKPLQQYAQNDSVKVSTGFFFKLRRINNKARDEHVPNGFSSSLTMTYPLVGNSIVLG